MSHFLRLLGESNKPAALAAACSSLRSGDRSSHYFQVSSDAFDAVPGKPFAYWISDSIRNLFRNLSGFEPQGGVVEVGLQTSDDTRFLRLWTEILSKQGRWVDFSKGGNFSRWYADPHLVVKSDNNFDEIVTFQNSRYPYLKGNARSLLHADISNFQRAGITWPLRARAFGPRILPLNCAFSIRGYAAFPIAGREFATLAIFNSTAFDYLFKVALGRFGFPEFLVGVLQRLPWVKVDSDTEKVLDAYGRAAWSLKYTLDTVEETSHAFVLPAALRQRLGEYDPSVIRAELSRMESEIDAISFEIYGFTISDRMAVQSSQSVSHEDSSAAGEDQNEEGENVDIAEPIDGNLGLLSWAVGVLFGRFDCRLATGERELTTIAEPFDPLPTKSPGMLPDGAQPFHTHTGILVDDEGHHHDLPYLLEEVLQRVDAPVQVDTRHWLRREFFPFHLQRYSKSRRKAPIYWPLSTLSGAYTLWLYYPDLTSQTLFSAVNDFIEPKLQQVRGDLESLRIKGNARSKQEEKQLEVASDLSQELADLRDALLAIAPKYSPKHDDGVQITAAPLWQLFRHKPWQKVLNDTWEKLEQGDYDWAHLAMNYWPERVLRKCHQDRSLAIAHDVEDTFWHEVEVPVMRGKKATGETKLEWQPKALMDGELDALIQVKIKERRA